MEQPDVQYSVTGFAEIDQIRSLWEQLNDHHYANARAFRDVYSAWGFDDRKAHFAKLALSGQFRIDLASDPVSGSHVGYCVSSLSPLLDGEIESVFVEAGFRSQGIGSALIARTLQWFERQGAQRVRVSVADGNEAAFPFYRKFGFYPRMTVLEQKKC